MNFQYASDLHLEHDENRIWLSLNQIKPVAPILFLAGDITVIQKGKVKHPDYFKWLSDNWEQVYIIPGNHEFYGSGRINQALRLNIEIHHNVRYINNTSLVFDDVEVFMTTLWSNCSTHLIETRIADFHYCRWGSNPYTYKHHNNLHEESAKWLDKAISSSKAKNKVIVTHFVPSIFVDAHPSGVDASSLMMKEYFVAKMEEYIKKWKVDYWIYGHNHWNNDVKFIETQFLSNMLGYCIRNENNGFIPDKTVII